MRQTRSLRHSLVIAAHAVAAVFFAGHALADEVQVAVAANFTGPAKVIAAEFEKTTGHKVILSFGATGKFYAQIQNGAPFDVLLAADVSTPEKLEKEGLTVPGSRFTYATGQLALWSTDPKLVDGKGDVLKTSQFRKLAIAAPKLAPYGAAAVETMTRMGVYDALQPKLVIGESIGQTFNFVSTGNAELGFVALAQVRDGGKDKPGSMWIVPAELHNPIAQGAVLLKRAESNPAASAWLATLKKAETKTLIRTYGYQVD